MLVAVLVSCADVSTVVGFDDCCTTIRAIQSTSPHSIASRSEKTNEYHNHYDCFCPIWSKAKEFNVGRVGYRERWFRSNQLLVALLQASEEWRNALRRLSLAVEWEQ